MSTTTQEKYSAGQTWGALRNAWKGYRIAKVQNDIPKMKEYAEKVRRLEGELGIKQAEFSCLS